MCLLDIDELSIFGYERRPNKPGLWNEPSASQAIEFYIESACDGLQRFWTLGEVLLNPLDGTRLNVRG